MENKIKELEQKVEKLEIDKKQLINLLTIALSLMDEHHEKLFTGFMDSLL